MSAYASCMLGIAMWSCIIATERHWCRLNNSAWLLQNVLLSVQDLQGEALYPFCCALNTSSSAHIACWSMWCSKFHLTLTEDVLWTLKNDAIQARGKYKQNRLIEVWFLPSWNGCPARRARSFWIVYAKGRGAVFQSGDLVSWTWVLGTHHILFCSLFRPLCVLTALTCLACRVLFKCI